MELGRRAWKGGEEKNRRLRRRENSARYKKEKQGRSLRVKLENKKAVRGAATAAADLLHHLERYTTTTTTKEVSGSLSQVSLWWQGYALRSRKQRDIFFFQVEMEWQQREF